MQRIDVPIGSKFNRLTVIGDPVMARNTGCLSAVPCLCECGAEVTVDKNKLRTGHTKSCGCLKIETAGLHRRTHQMEHSPTHVSWRGMLERCANPNHKGWPRYGGRGIEVCERWRDSFSDFLADMGERPDGCSIDRIDNNKNYEPGNCRWATLHEQASNKSNNVYMEIDGVRRTISEWSRITGISVKNISRRLKRGLPPVEVIREAIA